MSTEVKEKPPDPSPTYEPRVPVSLLLVGGVILVAMGQAIYFRVAPQNRYVVGLLIGVGLAAFALAAYLIARRSIPRRLIRLSGWLQRFLGITAGQLVLLFFAPSFALMAAMAAGDKLEALNLPLYLAAWLIAIVAVVVGGYQPTAPGTITVDRRDVIIVTALFLLAFLLRVVAIGNLPPTLSGDEGSSGLMAVRFLNGEADNVLTVGWFSFPSLYFAVQGMGIGLLGQTAAGLRITSALAGALTVAGLYWLARTMFGRLAAVMAAISLTALHYHVHFSRIGLNNIWDGLFAVVTMAALYHGWKRGWRTGFLVGGLALGLGQYFYVSLRVFPLLVLLWGGMAALLERPVLKRRLADLILLMYVALILALPLLFFFWQYPDEFNAPLQRVTVFDGWLDEASRLEGKAPAQVIVDQILKSAMGFTHLPLRHWYNPGSPLLLAGAAGFFLLGFFWALVNFDLRYWLVLLPLLAVVLLGGVSQDAPASQRYVIAAPMAAMLVVLPLAATAEWLQRAWPRYRFAVATVAMVITLWLVFQDIRYYFFEVYDTYVLGGLNTEVATSVAYYLDAQEPSPEVYFFGFPRMSYDSLSTIPYLVPQVTAHDIRDPLENRPEWDLHGPAIFIFLPEREGEVRYIRAAYPGGHYRQFSNANGTELFTAYEVTGPFTEP